MSSEVKRGRNVENSEREVSKTKEDSVEMSVDEAKIKLAEFLSKSDFFAGVNKFEEALNFLKEAKEIVKIFDKNQNLLSVEDQEIFSNWIKIIAEKENQITNQWIENLKEITERDPKKIDAWLTLGKLFASQGKDKKVCETFKTALEKNPDSPEKGKIWQEWGNFFAKNNDTYRLITCYLNALEAGMKKFGIFYNLGVGFLNLEIGDTLVNILKAIKYFEEASKYISNASQKIFLKKMQGFSSLTVAKMGCSLKNAPEILDSYKNALNAYNEVLKEDPHDEEALFNRGLLLLILKEGTPSVWGKESKDCFNAVLESQVGEEVSSEIIPMAYLQKAAIARFLFKSNPFTYGDKNGEIENLKECSNSLEKALSYFEELNKKGLLTPRGQEAFQITQMTMNDLTEELSKKEKGGKRLEEKLSYIY